MFNKEFLDRVKNVWLGSNILVLMLCSAHGVTFAQERVAILTEVRGDVKLARAGSDSFLEDAEFGTPLYRDDRIRTSKSASVSILYSNGDLLQLGSNRSVEIGSVSSDRDDDTERIEVNRQTSSSAANLALHRSGDGEIAALTGLRSATDRNTISIISPANSSVRTKMPVFEWTGGDHFDSYRLKLFTADGVVWEGESSSAVIVYPKTAPGLEPEIDYFWQVFGETLLDEESSDVSRLWILDDESIQMISEIETNLSLLNTGGYSDNYHLLAGSLYAEFRLFSEAIAEFSILASAYPSSALPFELLAQVYAEMGNTNLALNALRTSAANTQ